MSALVKPKVVTIRDIDGDDHDYVISRLPATESREMLAKYPLTNLPKLGDYLQSEMAMLNLMNYVGVVLGDDKEPTRLETVALVNNHVPDGETLVKLEIEMLKYNTTFFGLVGSPDLVEGLIKKYLPLLMKTLTESLEPSSAKDSQP